MSPPLILWKVSTINPDVASIRYRCFIVVDGLAKLGYRSVILDNTDYHHHPPRIDIEQFSAIIFVKAFSTTDLRLARDAKVAGVPIILDLCDNIFLHHYKGPGKENFSNNFVQMLDWAAALVTTGPALSEILRREIGTHHTIVEIPDGMEEIGLADRTMKANQQSRALLSLRKTPPGPSVSKHIKRFVRRSKDQLNQRVDAKNIQIAPITKDPGATQWILWFGNKGRPEGHDGIRSILLIEQHLSAVFKQVPFELIVCSNCLETYRRHIEPLSFPTRYYNWSQSTCDHLIAQSDIVVIPFSDDDFSRVKSANRAVLSLSLGTAVVATLLPSMRPLADVIGHGSWREALATYLLNPKLARAHVEKAQSIIKDHFSGPVIAKRWDTLLRATK